jgi:hypothetical protein
MLRQESLRDPGNLYTRLALNSALASAGLVKEAHALAWENYERMQRLPAVGAEVQINVGLGLAEAGRGKEAMQCVELGFHRNPSDGDVIYNVVGVGVRFGDLAWLARLLPQHPVLDFLQHHKLADAWPEQQRAIEAVIGPHVSGFGGGLEDFHDGTWRLVLDYFTDTVDFAKIATLEDAVWTAVERVHATHPEGPGVLLGAVVLNIHGVQVPLPEAQ